MKSIQHSKSTLEYDLSKATFNRHKNNGKNMLCSHIQCGIPLKIGDRIVRLMVTRTATMRLLHKKCAEELNII